jgi:hypothetical protein
MPSQVSLALRAPRSQLCCILFQACDQTLKPSCTYALKATGAVPTGFGGAVPIGFGGGGGGGGGAPVPFGGATPVGASIAFYKDSQSHKVLLARLAELTRGAVPLGAGFGGAGAGLPVPLGGGGGGGGTPVGVSLLAFYGTCQSCSPFFWLGTKDLQDRRHRLVQEGAAEQSQRARQLQQER